MLNFWTRNKREIIAFLLLFAALLLRMSWFGFSYNMQIDDYIHYRVLAEGSDPVQICIEKGLFTSRPLAGLLDLAFWGRFPAFLGSVLLCILYAASGVLFLKLFSGLFGTGCFFLTVYALLPLGFEGTYWHAAATRIIPALFFTALAITELARFVETKKKLWLLTFLVWSLLSFCFYEQTLVLSLALSLMLTLVWLLQKKRHALWGLSVFAPVGVYAVVTKYFSTLADGQLASRMNLILPNDPTFFTTHMESLLNQLDAVFLDGGWLTMSRGFVRGLELIVSEGLWAAVLIPVFAAGVYLLLRRSGPDTVKLGWIEPVFAILAAVAPLTPFVILAKPWICLRSAVPSFLGLALLADWLARLILRKRTAAWTALFAAVCMVASVSELYDYHSVARTNEQVAEAILSADEEYDFTGKVGILSLNQLYTEEQNYLYRDHVMSAHASDWALTGLVRYYARLPEIDFTPVPLATDAEAFWYTWSKPTKNLDNFGTLLLYDHASGTMEPLTARRGEGEEWFLYDAAGALRGRVWEESKDLGMIEFYNE